MKKPDNKSKGLPDRQIEALVQLLADENAQVAETIQSRFLELGEHAVPYLEEALAHPKEIVREAADNLLLKLRSEKVFQQFQTFSRGDADLEEGAFLLAQYAAPNFDVPTYQRKLDDMAKELKKRISAQHTPEVLIQTISHYLFAELGFQGNSDDFLNPENSYLNRVLDRKLGIPISLSAIYLFIGRRLGLPLVGVGMPGHFLTAYHSKEQMVLIDPFNAGQVLTREACVQFVTRDGHPWQDAYLAPTPDRQILARMIRNLISSYSRLGENTRAKTLNEYLACLIN